MDVLLRSLNQPRESTPAIDGRAPPAALTLLTLSLLDTEIEALYLKQICLLRRLDQIGRQSRAACEELRTQEIHMTFVESFSRYTAPPDTLRRLRGWLEDASQKCATLSTLARAETEAAARVFDSIHGRVQELYARRRTMSISTELLALYEASYRGGASRAIVPVERGACGGCGAGAPAIRPESGIAACGTCRRLLYWRVNA
jgi:hypothetical protein